MCGLEAESTLDIHHGRKNILFLFYFLSKQTLFKPRAAPWHRSAAFSCKLFMHSRASEEDLGPRGQGLVTPAPG